MNHKIKLLESLEVYPGNEDIEWKFGNTGGIVSVQEFRQMVIDSPELFAEKVLWRTV